MITNDPQLKRSFPGCVQEPIFHEIDGPEQVETCCR